MTSSTVASLAPVAFPCPAPNARRIAPSSIPPAPSHSPGPCPDPEGGWPPPPPSRWGIACPTMLDGRAGAVARPHVQLSPPCSAGGSAVLQRHAGRPCRRRQRPPLATVVASVVVVLLRGGGHFAACREVSRDDRDAQRAHRGVRGVGLGIRRRPGAADDKDQRRAGGPEQPQDVGHDAGDASDSRDSAVDTSTRPSPAAATAARRFSITGTREWALSGELLHGASSPATTRVIRRDAADETTLATTHRSASSWNSLALSWTRHGCSTYRRPPSSHQAGDFLLHRQGRAQRSAPPRPSIYMVPW